jgi:branched-chain amino acid transport system permease protein
MSATTAPGRLGRGGALGDLRSRRWWNLAVFAVLFTAAAVLPFFFDPSASFMLTATLAVAYTVMALGLNIIVGFAGLLDLGYVAFYAFGAYAVGWLGSTFFASVNGGEGLYVLISSPASGNLTPPGIHANFLIVLVAAVIVCVIVGVLIGLPTLRLRGDYIAIVTLAFGEIIGIVAENGDRLVIFGQKVTNGKQGISPIDRIDLPLLERFQLAAIDTRPWYWFALFLVAVVLFVNFRLRDSRLGRAWIALREDEVAAASMGVPLVKTKLLAYATGAAFGGISGAFLASLLNTVNADQFAFSFSIFILAMVILGGLGSIWGVVLGAVLLSIINFWLIPEVLNEIPRSLGIEGLDLTELSFGIFGFLLVIMMVLRPEGLLPERRRQVELTEGVGTDDPIYEARQA